MINERFTAGIRKDLEVFGKIIDVHGHLGPTRVFDIPYNNIEGIIESMDSAGVEKTFISSLEGLCVDCRAGNDLVADAVNRHKDRVLGYASINPWERKEIIPELERCFDKLNLSAIKLHPFFSKYPADGENYTPVYEFAQERKAVILNHIWGTAGHLKMLASKYYNVTFIQAHIGGMFDGYTQNDFLDITRGLDNVYVDTASSKVLLYGFEKLVEYLGADKIIFGSDCTYMDMTYQLGRVLFSSIGKDALSKILRSNILKLLNPNSIK